MEGDGGGARISCIAVEGGGQRNAGKGRSTSGGGGGIMGRRGKGERRRGEIASIERVGNFGVDAFKYPQRAG